MGRAKLNMQLINSEKARHTTFQKRKNGLKKKIYELKTLCSVEVCLIIYGPKIDVDLAPDPEIWPPNHEEIHELIDEYKKQSMEDRKRRTIDLSHFFKDRNRKVEEAIMKLRTKNEAKYPTWDDRYNEFSEEDLNDFFAILDNKIQEVKARVEMIKGNTRLAATTDMVDMVNMESTPNDSYFMQGLLRRGDMQLEEVHHEQKMNSNEVDLIPMHHHPFDQQNHQTLEFDGSISNFVYNPFNRQIYYDPLMVGMIDHNMVVTNNNNIHRPLPMGYYGSTVQPFVAPFVQYPVMASSSSSSKVLHASQMDQYYYQVSHELHDDMKDHN